MIEKTKIEFTRNPLGDPYNRIALYLIEIPVVATII